MELNEDFKRACSIKNDLETQLLNINARNLEQEFNEVSVSIEKHFGELMSALAERKEALLKETKTLFKLQQRDLSQAEEEIRGHIQACNDIIKAGSTFFTSKPSTASSIWKSVGDLNTQNQIKKLEFSPSSAFLQSISEYGQVASSKLVELPQHCYYAGAVATFTGPVIEANVETSPSHFTTPEQICFHSTEKCLYASDKSGIRRISMNGDVSLLITTIFIPSGIAISKQGTIYFLSGNSLKEISTSTGKFWTIAGTVLEGLTATSTAAGYEFGQGITVDMSDQSIYICDTLQHSIRKVTPQGVVTTVAGKGEGKVDGLARDAQFAHPTGIAWHPDGYLIICDTTNNSIRKMTLTGDMNVTTIVNVMKPERVTLLQNGEILVSSPTLHMIFVITPQGTAKYDVKPFAGSYEQGYLDGNGLEAQFNTPKGIVVDEGSGMCYVCDSGNHKIRSIQLLRK